MSICVIVDAYGPGMFFVSYLKAHGHNVLHIQSSKDIPPPFLLSIKNAGFIDNIAHTGDTDDLINTLKKYGLIQCIIPGFETGVMLADILSEKLFLKGNGVTLSQSRRNKYQMMEALKSRNVPTVNYLKTSDCNRGITWVANTTTYPVVAKPIDSASSEDVYICNNDNELKIAFENILKKTNLMGLENNEVLVQSFLHGSEYVVNSVSCNGIHYVTDMWVCKKRIISNRVIYDKEELIPFDGNIQKSLISYIHKVLNALGIQYGPAHSEVIITNQGPILLETGARIGGAVHPEAHNKCLGYNQVELTVDAYLNPENFHKKTTKPYKFKKNMYVVMVVSEKDGIIKDIPLENILKKLNSLFHIRLKKQIGDRLVKTIDLSSSPATIYLMLEDKDQLEREYQSLLLLCSDAFILE